MEDYYRSGRTRVNIFGNIVVCGGEDPHCAIVVYMKGSFEMANYHGSAFMCSCS